MTRQKGIIYMGVPMLRELPVFVFVCVYEHFSTSFKGLFGNGDIYCHKN